MVKQCYFLTIYHIFKQMHESILFCGSLMTLLEDSHFSKQFVILNKEEISISDFNRLKSTYNVINIKGDDDEY